MLYCRLSVLVSLLTTAFITKLSAGGFLAAQQYPAGTLPTMGIVADVNNDGLPDLVVGNQYSHDVSVLLGKPNGTFGRFRAFPAGIGVSEIATGDFNEDGRVDLATQPMRLERSTSSLATATAPLPLPHQSRSIITLKASRRRTSMATTTWTLSLQLWRRRTGRGPACSAAGEW